VKTHRLQEDKRIIELVSEMGPKKWSVIAQELPGRIGKQCRERWHNHLNPDIRRDDWTAEEDRKLLEVSAPCSPVRTTDARREQHEREAPSALKAWQGVNY
jgi:hypothetical protein